MSEVDTLLALRRFIEGDILRGRIDPPLDLHAPLVTSGLLDSLATLELLGFLEDELGVHLEAHEVDWSTMDTLEAIHRVIQSKRAPG